MKTLVTGANGLLGANLVRELIGRGHQVRALVREKSDLKSIQGIGIELCFGDLLNECEVERACKGMEFVIHAASRTLDLHSKFPDYLRVNVTGTKNVLRAAEQSGVSRMVYVSSCCVFGGGSLENPSTELSEFTGFRFNSPYINSKYLAQQWVLSEVEQKGFPVVIVNPTIMLGPYDSPPSSGEIILRILRQKYQLCPISGKNYIDVRDVAKATCNALNMGMPGECYLLGSENLSFSVLYEKVNRIFGRNNLLLMVPGTLLKCAGLMGNVVRAIARRDLPLNFFNSRLLAYESYFSAGKAIRELNLPQRPVDEAIRDAIEWFCANDYVKPNVTEAPLVAAVA